MDNIITEITGIHQARQSESLNFMATMKTNDPLKRILRLITQHQMLCKETKDDKEGIYNALCVAILRQTFRLKYTYARYIQIRVEAAMELEELGNAIFKHDQINGKYATMSMIL